MSYNKFFLFMVASLIATQKIHAVEYDVRNTVPTTPGGVKFTNQYGDAYSKQILASSTDFIWRVFQQNNEADRKSLERVSLIIESKQNSIAYTINNEIYMSAEYIDRISGDVKTEITGVLYHEMSHVWQWFGNPRAPPGLIEGIADFVRLKADYIPSHWVKPGGGDQWDQGYAVTARFLDYCNGLRNGFVAELNKKIRNGYDANYFVELLGKTVDQLWSDYKSKYPN